jgi:transcriptional regulator with XRE-family HTH domain
MKISIKAARVNAELNITKAAEELGVATSTLSGYENGAVVPRYDMLVKMSALYNIPIENLRVKKEG